MKKIMYKILSLGFLINPFVVNASENVVCRDYNVIRVFKFLSILIYFVKIMVPIILILVGMYSLFKVIINNEQHYLKSNIKMFLIKVLVGVFIFFVPTLFNVFFTYLMPIDNSNTFFSECGKCLMDTKFCDEQMEIYPEKMDELPNREESNDIVINNNNSSYNNPVIEAPKGAKIVSSGKSDTFVYSIQEVKKSGYGTYYLTRVWVKDAYNQLNKFDSPNYGKETNNPSDILAYGVKKNNMKDKLIVGFNASGLYLKGVFEPEAVKKYAGYNKTSKGTLVITNGKVIRNVYNKWSKKYTIMGVTPDQKMRLWIDNKEKSDEIKKQKNQEIIDSKIRNTYTFNGPLVVDGKESNIKTSFSGDTSNKRRQAICQINENNFVLITSKYSNEALNRAELVKIMLSLKCQTGTNLDGGGSIALLVKNKNSNKIKVITGDKRNLSEVAYFSELG